MSSETHFGVERRKYTKAEGVKIDAIAEVNDCTHVRVNLPGEGWRAWFATRDYGFSATRDTEAVVRSAMEAAGLWGDDADAQCSDDRR